MTAAHAPRVSSLILAALLVAGPAAGGAHPGPRLPLGHEALALEREAGAEVGRATAALDRVVEAARAGLPALTPEATLGVLAEAAALACPALVAGRAGTLLSEALASGRCDCDVLTVAYLTVADVVGLPLHAVFLPGHVLVLWDDGRRRIYWETTASEARPAWAVEALVPEGADHAYLRPQTRQEMIGYFVQIRASHRLAAGDPEAALADYDLAARLGPSFPITFHNRGRAHLLGGRYARALADFDRAARLDPSYADAHYGRGLAFVALGRSREALDALALVSALEGAAGDVRHAEGLAYLALGDDATALAKFDEAIVLDPGGALAYEARGALHERQGDAEAARRDYGAFVRLAVGTEHEGLIPEVEGRLRRLGAA